MNFLNKIDITLKLDRNTYRSSSLIQVSCAQNSQAHMKILKAFLILRLNTTESMNHSVPFVVVLGGTCFLDTNMSRKNFFTRAEERVCRGKREMKSFLVYLSTI